MCHLFATRPDYRALWGGNPDEAVPVASVRYLSPVPQPAKVHLPICENLGGGVGCVRRRCDKGHGGDAGVKPCVSCGPQCNDYDPIGGHPEPYSASGTRHLLYHVMPVAGNGTWQRNLDQLIPRMGVFNGRKIIAIAVDHKGKFPTDKADVVREYLRNVPGIEYVETPNVPSLREVATWPKLWERLSDLKGTDDHVFYAHAKAVTRPWNPGVTCHPWATLMYDSLLDFMPVVEDQLKRFPITGSFKKVGRGFTGRRSQWHYSGSFFWIRIGEAFKGNRIGQVDKQWFGNESWPGMHFPVSDAGCVFHEGTIKSLDLYRQSHLDLALAEFRKWKAANSASGVLT